MQKNRTHHEDTKKQRIFRSLSREALVGDFLPVVVIVEAWRVFPGVAADAELLLDRYPEIYADFAPGMVRLRLGSELLRARMAGFALNIGKLRGPNHVYEAPVISKACNMA